MLPNVKPLRKLVLSLVLVGALVGGTAFAEPTGSGTGGGGLVAMQPLESLTFFLDSGVLPSANVLLPFLSFF